ncbi:MAG: M23 family metallopeptidase [Gorillibacterium sp.]|nr:M23 family metallopeptidase [Gorillibacterium sp.]
MNPFEDYQITSPFGYRTLNGSKEFHTGIDLVKGYKEPVYAFCAGEVIHAKEGVTGSGFGNYGIVVAIKDKAGRLQVYAHLESVAVKVGAIVIRGQNIGKQGNSGKVLPAPTAQNPAAGSHLHYEVRKVAESHPPYGWIADRVNNCLDPTQYLIDFYRSDINPVKVVEPTMKAEDATKITALLGQVYNMAKATGAPADALKEIGRLADEIRVTVGLPKQND